MATSLENLTAALANLDARLLEVTAAPKPSYGIDGKSVSWGEYFNNLMAARKGLMDLILREQNKVSGRRELRVIVGRRWAGYPR
jgi:hypothetical protein